MLEMLGGGGEMTVADFGGELWSAYYGPRKDYIIEFYNGPNLVRREIRRNQFLGDLDDYWKKLRSQLGTGRLPSITALQSYYGDGSRMYVAGDWWKHSLPDKVPDVA